jgi:hypothetical protein
MKTLGDSETWPAPWLTHIIVPQNQSLSKNAYNVAGILNSWRAFPRAELYFSPPFRHKQRIS